MQAIAGTLAVLTGQGHAQEKVTEFDKAVAALEF